jgi:hypothetical protein
VRCALPPTNQATLYRYQKYRTWDGFELRGQVERYRLFKRKKKKKVLQPQQSNLVEPFQSQTSRMSSQCYFNFFKRIFLIGWYWSTTEDNQYCTRGRLRTAELGMDFCGSVGSRYCSQYRHKATEAKVIKYRIHFSVCAQKN